MTVPLNFLNIRTEEDVDNLICDIEENSGDGGYVDGGEDDDCYDGDDDS